jgi:CDP-6-deoxy-D-xylo-4-hexulose-3-dehydrase
MEPVFGDIAESTFHLHSWNILRSHQDIGLILPAHLFGYAANMPAILERAGWTLDQTPVAEDACEAHGTTINNQLVGTFGLWSAFSFYIAHIVQAGELGCLCTNDDEIAAIARSIKVHGRACDCKICTRNESYCPYLDQGDPRFTFNYIGYNFKPMEFQAALARVQMRHLEENFEKRRENFRELKALLDLRGYINPIYEQPGMVPFAMPIILQKEGIRDQVVAQLEQQGVEARPLFGCIPTQQPAYAEYKERHLGTLPVAEYYGANGFYVGCHQYLGAIDIMHMAGIIEKVVKGLS